MKIKGTKGIIGVTGLGVGLGIIGEGIKPINSGIGESITQSGQTATSFISPMVNISMGGYTIKQLKKIKQ